MCDQSCIRLGQTYFTEDRVRGKSVIEVGSRNVNGSLRPIIEALNPQSYIGVDLEEGLGVDEICDAGELVDRFGSEAFDLLISTFLVEHVNDWRRVISNFKHVLKPNGILLVSTASKDFPYHGYPFDYWRYELDDLQIIFSDFIVELLEEDISKHLVYIIARKPPIFEEKDLSDYQLYSIIRGARAPKIFTKDVMLFKIKHPSLGLRKIAAIVAQQLPVPVKHVIKRLLVIWGRTRLKYGHD